VTQKHRDVNLSRDQFLQQKLTTSIEKVASYYIIC